MLMGSTVNIHNMIMKERMKFTACIRENLERNGYIGAVKEFPGVMSQGKTKEDLIENLMDAIRAMRAAGVSSADSRFRESWKEYLDTQYTSKNSRHRKFTLSTKA